MLKLNKCNNCKNNHYLSKNNKYCPKTNSYNPRKEYCENFRQ